MSVELDTPPAASPVPAPPARPPAALGPRPSAGEVVGSIVLHGCILALALLFLLPFAWLVCASFRRQEDFFNFTFLPSPLSRLTFSNYTWLVTHEPFLRWMFNSLFLASAHTVLVVTLSSLGGFALAKYKFPGRRVLMVIMLATMMLPAQVLLPSSYELMFRIGWIDSYAAIVVPGAVSVFGMFLFMQAMRGVPDELLQAGRVDGCSELRLWWEIALPVVRPMIGAYTLLSFMGSWNSFVWPQIVLQNQDHFTLPIAMTNMIGLPEYEAPLGGIMAGTLLSILPIAILFFILQKDFIAGLTSGAVKG
jgi:ABC-type glycerol-3-phosphate transport system permease component